MNACSTLRRFVFLELKHAQENGLLSPSSVKSTTEGAPALSSRGGYLFSGVRPSPGAASSQAQAGRRKSTPPFPRRVAAPGDAAPYTHLLDFNGRSEAAPCNAFSDCFHRQAHPNLAKRMECAQLAAAFKHPAPYDSG